MSRLRSKLVYPIRGLNTVWVTDSGTPTGSNDYEFDSIGSALAYVYTQTRGHDNRWAVIYCRKSNDNSDFELRDNVIVSCESPLRAKLTGNITIRSPLVDFVTVFVEDIPMIEGFLITGTISNYDSVSNGRVFDCWFFGATFAFTPLQFLLFFNCSVFGSTGSLANLEFHRTHIETSGLLTIIDSVRFVECDVAACLLKADNNDTLIIDGGYVRALTIDDGAGNTLDLSLRGLNVESITIANFGGAITVRASKVNELAVNDTWTGGLVLDYGGSVFLTSGLDPDITTVISENGIVYSGQEYRKEIAAPTLGAISTDALIINESLSFTKSRLGGFEAFHDADYGTVIHIYAAGTYKFRLWVQMTALATIDLAIAVSNSATTTYATGSPSQVPNAVASQKRLVGASDEYTAIEAEVKIPSGSFVTFLASGDVSSGVNYEIERRAA